MNLAAQAGVRYSLKYPESYIQSNIVGFGNIIESCKDYKVDHLLDNMKIKEGKKKEKTNIRSSPSTINNTYESSHPGDVIMIDGKTFKVIDIGKM